MQKGNLGDSGRLNDRQNFMNTGENVNYFTRQIRDPMKTDMFRTLYQAINPLKPKL